MHCCERFATELLNRHKCAKQKAFVFIIHNPGVLLNETQQIKQLVNETERVYVLGLGPHVAEVLSEYVSGWGRIIGTDYIIPIFPIDHLSKSNSREKGFVLQGSINSQRRNYKGILADISSKKDAIPPEFKLIILGNGNFTIPEGTHPAVRLRKNEKYPEFYGVIRNNSALLTAFASGVYFKEKASATVVASLICRTPLLTTAETLRAYSYLSPSSVWLKDSSESDLDAMLRILKTPNFPNALEERILSLNKDFQRATDRNIKVAVKVVKAIMKKSTKF